MTALKVSEADFQGHGSVPRSGMEYHHNDGVLVPRLHHAVMEYQ